MIFIGPIQIDFLSLLLLSYTFTGEASDKEFIPKVYR